MKLVVPGGLLRAVNLRPGEASRLLLFSLLAMLAIAEAVLIRTFSDARFLATFPVAWLPFFFLANAVAFLPASLAYGALSRRLPRHALHAGMLTLFAGLSLASLWALATHAQVFSVVLLLAVISPLVNVVAWSSILGRLNSREARRLVPLISAGATAGGILAGLLAIPFIHYFGVDRLLLPIAGIDLLLALLVRPRATALPEQEVGQDRRLPQPPAAAAPAPVPGSRELLSNRLLMLLSAAVLLMSLCTNLADYAFKDVLQQRYAPDLAGMAQFLAYFHSLSNVVILLVQLLLVGKVVRTIGLQASFALHPLVMLGGLALFAVAPVLAIAAFWRLADNLLKFAFNGPILEMAVTPVPRGLRDRGRVLLKGTMHPLGGFLAGALLLGVGLVSGSTLWKVLPGVGLAGGLWLFLTLRLKARYLEQLRSTLSVPELATVPELGTVGTEGGAGAAEGGWEPVEPKRTRSGVIRLVDGQVRILQEVVARGTIDGRQLQQALDRLFVLLGDLGDRATVDLVRRRYQRGNLATKAVALELLEMHLDERRVAEAVALLETLAPELVEDAARLRAEARVQRQQATGIGGRLKTLIIGR